MRLSRTKSKGRAIQHPFYKLILPDAIPDDEKPGLISEIKGGSIGAGHRVILSHLRMTLSIVGRYMACLDNQSKSDELVSAAVEGLVSAVNNIRENGLPHDNLTGYLVENVHTYISTAIEKFPTVRIPGRTKRRHKGKFVTPTTAELTDKVIDQHFDRKISQSSQIEADEMVEQIVQSPRERQVIELRIEGYKDAEIAKLIGLGTTTVFVIRTQLQERFISLFGEIR